MPNDSFYRSAEWRALRARVLARDQYRCVKCGADIRGKGMARVDHIKPRRQYPALAMAMSNLRSLCATCDNVRHSSLRLGGFTPNHGVAADGSPLDPRHAWFPGRGCDESE